MSRPEQIPLDFDPRPAQGREDFWVAAANRDAVAWIDRWPDWPARVLVLSGPPASGKTHLLRVWQQKTGAAEISHADLGAADAAEAPRRCRILDDADRIVGDPAREESLVHLINRVEADRGFLLMSGATAAADWPVALPDLASRLRAALGTAVQPPDDELLAVVLTKMFADRQMFVPQEVIAYLLARSARSFAALRDLVDRLDRRALAEKRAVTLGLAREVLKDGGDAA